MTSCHVPLRMNLTAAPAGNHPPLAPYPPVTEVPRRGCGPSGWRGPIAIKGWPPCQIGDYARALPEQCQSPGKTSRSARPRRRPIRRISITVPGRDGGPTHACTRPFARSDGWIQTSRRPAIKIVRRGASSRLAGLACTVSGSASSPCRRAPQTRSVCGSRQARWQVAAVPRAGLRCVVIRLSAGP
jgi:hypothetical protein